MKQNQVQQKEIRLGTHGEHYGSWMSNPVFYVMGALLALVCGTGGAVLCGVPYHGAWRGVLVIAAVILLALLLWVAWIRQYAFGEADDGADPPDRPLPIWILTGRDSFWRWAAAPGHYPSGRP